MGLKISMLVMFLPSGIKIKILNKMGHRIGNGCYIGFSVLDVERIELSDNCYIGHGNIFKRIKKLTMGKGARINRWNYFTSSQMSDGQLTIGDFSSISMRHYFDICCSITIGSNTIVAGINSTFFTHSKGIDPIDYVKPIEIGNWCYIGSNCYFVPGAKIDSYCFVGMGSVLTRDYSGIQYALLAGNPASVKKSLPRDGKYFRQEHLLHPHMISKSEK